MATKRKDGAAGEGAESTGVKAAPAPRGGRKPTATKTASAVDARPAAAKKPSAPRKRSPASGKAESKGKRTRPKARRAGLAGAEPTPVESSRAEPKGEEPRPPSSSAPKAGLRPKAAPKAKGPPPRSGEVSARPEAPTPAVIEVRGDEPDAEADPAAKAKLAVGPGAEEGQRPAQIPWSYGQDRVTAMAVDPDKLFVYWEVTDPAIERARAALGKGGPGAWLNLRVYDTSGLIFDGTNAHSYFDHAVDRATRQWFFHVGKPGSTAFVELGMRSSEGYFVRIVRSGRVDFPRREPAPWSDPEWMTVRPWSGEVAEVHRAPAARPGGGPAGSSGETGAGGVGAWTLHDPGVLHEVVLRQLIEGGWERVEWRQGEGEGWYELEGRVEWESPRTLTSWEAGPFDEPVRIEPPRRQEREAQGFAYRTGGITHVVEGPWTVEIRGIGARARREVIARWEITRSWSILGGRIFRARFGGEGAIGGSEGRWIAGSEVRLGGASERWRIGASEVAWRGASERMLMGASRWRQAGASERAYAGASERRLGGASERAFAGASEARLGGGSERTAGGSEGRLGGSGEHFDGPTAPPLPYPPSDPGAPGREE